MIYFRKIVLFVGMVFLIGCIKDEPSNASNEILFLRVDFTTYKFEGGKTIFLSGDITNSDTIPISIDYKAPGDFGNITLFYQPNNEIIFDASIIWMGTGEIQYPEYFNPPGFYDGLNQPIKQPENSDFQEIFNAYQTDHAQIWNAINRLRIVDDYLESGKKIGLFLYTPSVGIGNPTEWDWFVIMNK